MSDVELAAVHACLRRQSPLLRGSGLVSNAPLGGSAPRTQGLLHVLGNGGIFEWLIFEWKNAHAGQMSVADAC
jgi:hypothetical protein